MLGNRRAGELRHRDHVDLGEQQLVDGVPEHVGPVSPAASSSASVNPITTRKLGDSSGAPTRAGATAPITISISARSCTETASTAPGPNAPSRSTGNCSAIRSARSAGSRAPGAAPVRRTTGRGTSRDRPGGAGRCRRPPGRPSRSRHRPGRRSPARSTPRPGSNSQSSISGSTAVTARAATGPGIADSPTGHCSPLEAS